MPLIDPVSAILLLLTGAHLSAEGHLPKQ